VRFGRARVLLVICSVVLRHEHSKNINCRSRQDLWRGMMKMWG
jgi:hypothetical protein